MDSLWTRRRELLPAPVRRQDEPSLGLLVARAATTRATEASSALPTRAPSRAWTSGRTTTDVLMGPSIRKRDTPALALGDRFALRGCLRGYPQRCSDRPTSGLLGTRCRHVVKVSGCPSRASIRSCPPSRNAGRPRVMRAPHIARPRDAPHSGSCSKPAGTPECALPPVRVEADRSAPGRPARISEPPAQRAATPCAEPSGARAVGQGSRTSEPTRRCAPASAGVASCPSQVESVT